jgi:EAL domain-containing protein (putative c-di-GMP-specific phosphodiesterase class I)
VAEAVFVELDAATLERMLRNLADKGIKIAMDEFGNGHAPLKHLRRFPIYTIKIDFGIMRDVTENAGDLAIVEATVACAKRLSIGVIANGIDNIAQAELAQAIGCGVGQGELFGQRHDGR